ncbi:MAG: sigma-70 family RNA polymerase sigma factor [Gemmatimonadetes bacterium]|nr:sigma-70 family RNA polymerase sigma factor [Gemmatimonadota bacterium]
MSERHWSAALVEAVRAGAPEALDELYRAYSPLVHRLAYRIIGSAADADDVLQDVFLGLPEALRSYEGRAALGEWIRRVAIRTALMRLRSYERRREDALQGTNYSVTDRSVAGMVDRLALQRALDTLPEELRVVFVLKEMEGYPHAEIAHILGISSSLSEVRLHRARKLLQEYLGR